MCCKRIEYIYASLFEKRKVFQIFLTECHINVQTDHSASAETAVLRDRTSLLQGGFWFQLITGSCNHLMKPSILSILLLSGVWARSILQYTKVLTILSGIPDSVDSQERYL